MKLTYEYVRDSKFEGPAFSVFCMDSGIELITFSHPDPQELEERTEDDLFDVFANGEYMDLLEPRYYFDQVDIFDNVLEASQFYKEVFL